MEISGRKIIKFAKKMLPVAVVTRGAINYMLKNPYALAKTLPTGERVYGLGMAIGDAITAGQNIVKLGTPLVKAAKAGIRTYGALLAVDAVVGLHNKARDLIPVYDKIQRFNDKASALPSAILNLAGNPIYGSKFSLGLKEKISLPVVKGAYRVGNYIGLGNIMKNMLNYHQEQLNWEKKAGRPWLKKRKKIIKKVFNK